MIFIKSCEAAAWKCTSSGTGVFSAFLHLCPEHTTGEDSPSAETSGHGFTVLNVVWQVKKSKCPAGSSLAFGPALWLCPAKELHSPSPPSSLIFGHGRDTTKSHRRHKSCALNAHVPLLLTSTRNLVDMTKVTSEVQCAGSLLVVVGGMRQQMRMA